MTSALRRALLGLGSNLGNRDANLRAALELLAADEAIDVVRVSRFRTTAPVGGPPQDDYRNAAALVETSLSAAELLGAAKRVEAALLRSSGGERWGPRTIDVDVLLVAEECIDTAELRVPHPRMAERRFVLQPAAEIAPDMRHPELGSTMAELFGALS